MTIAKRRGGTSLWHDPHVARLMLLSASATASSCATFTSVPLWATQHGIGTASAGLPIAVLLAATITAQPVVPALLGRVHPNVLQAAGLVALAAASAAYLFGSQLWVLCLTGIVRGWGLAVLTVVGTALVQTITSSERQGEMAGLYGVANTSAGLICIPLGAALTQAGLFGLVILIATMPLLAVPIALGLPATPSATTPRRDQARPGRGQSASIRPALLPSVVLIAVMIANGGFISYLPVARPTGHLASAALLMMGLGSVLTRWRVGGWADRHGYRVLLPLASVTSAIGALLIAHALAGHGAGDVIVVLGGSATFGASYGVILTITLVATFASVPIPQATTASVMWNISVDGGQAAGAAGVGALAAGGAHLVGALETLGLVALVSLPIAIIVGARGSSPGMVGPEGSATE